MLSSALTFGQVVLYEDFEGGLSLPTGWTNNDLSGGGTWTFETGGAAALLAPGNTAIYTSGMCEGNYAAFDSDAYGNDSMEENAALESPVFDASSLTSVTLGYSHFFAGDYGGVGYVEVSTDGTTWTTVETHDGDGYRGGNTTLDVTSELGGSPTAQVRFRWTGDWAVAWYVDNISVYQCTVSAPNAVVSATAPEDNATGVPIAGPAAPGGPSSVGPFEWEIATTGDAAVSYNFNLGITPAGNDIGSIPGVASGVIINFGWEPNTTYYWFVESVNCGGVTTGPVWSFTTGDVMSIEDNIIEAFSVYPNPTTDVLNIKSTQDIDNVTVFNLLGQSVASFSKNEITNSSVNLSDLSEGLYLVKITSGDKTQTLRVTKE